MFWDKFKKRGAILMYHRIIDSDFNPCQLNVSPAHFEEQLQVIKKLGRPVPLQGMVKNLQKFSFGKKEIVLTFDDGYADNFHNAKPILEKYGIPATFYIISGAIGHRERFFWDDLEQDILAPQTLPESFESSIGGKEFFWQVGQEGPCRLLDYAKLKQDIPSNGSVVSRQQLYGTLNQMLSTLSADEKTEALHSIARWSGQTSTAMEDAAPMRLDELTALARCPLFEIGAHTVNHPHLKYIPVDRQKDEISRSRQDLENKISKRITSFSYPYGSFAQETVELLKSLDFQNACSVIHGAVLNTSNKYLLPRFAIGDWDGDVFQKKLNHWLQ